MRPRTMYEKIWDAHVVHEAPGQPALIYVDRHLIHEGTSPQAFAGLKAAVVCLGLYAHQSGRVFFFHSGLASTPSPVTRNGGFS